jgi:enoyl-CoA hydratase
MTEPDPRPTPEDAPILRETLAGVGVAVLTLNRPEALNALSGAVMRALEDALGALEADDAVRCVVLQGAGRAFAAGADVRAMTAAGAAETLPAELDLWARVRAFEKPLIAAVHGYALGGGCELAQACDIVIAADDARFGLPELALGIIPGAGGTQLTPRAIGKSLAMELVLAGRMLTADEALAHGLCSRVVPREALHEEAVALATTIASRPPIAARLAKRAVADAYETSLAAGVARERTAFETAFATEDAHEGIRAFVEKRTARFEGR